MSNKTQNSKNRSKLRHSSSGSNSYKGKKNNVSGRHSKKSRKNNYLIRKFEDYNIDNVFLQDDNDIQHSKIIVVNKLESTRDKHTYYPSSFILVDGIQNNNLVIHKFKCVEPELEPIYICNIIYALHPLVIELLYEKYEQKNINKIIKKLREIEQGQSLIIEINPQSDKTFLTLQQSHQKHSIYNKPEEYIVKHSQQIIINGPKSNCIRFINDSANNDNNNNTLDYKQQGTRNTKYNNTTNFNPNHPIQLPLSAPIIMITGNNDNFGAFNETLFTPQGIKNKNKHTK